ncbi:YheC/YheD family protein [Candidatus Woesearchaeota archaeon]|nr:YheC/YheD family protein [Candidatus Woesearchaeota archaeon]
MAETIFNMRKHYVIAGLDFIFDKSGKPWFLEANSAPTVHKVYEELYGKCDTVKAIARYINSLKGDNFCIFASKTWAKKKSKKENSFWLAEKLRPYVKKNFHMCYMQDNLRVGRKFFLDHNFIRLTLTNFNRGGGNGHVINSSRRKVKPDIIFRSHFQLNYDFEKENIEVLNSMVARDIVWLKNKCYDVVKNIKGINIPKYFMVDSNEELKKILQENKKLFAEGYVLKPSGDSLGRGIKITNSGRMPYKFSVKPGYMVQQKIDCPLIDGKYYWDTRIFVINGKFIGGVKRLNKNRITNISRGGHGAKLEKEYQKKIERVSREITEEINREAKKLSEEGCKYILTPEKPSLREARWHPVGEE